MNTAKAISGERRIQLPSPASTPQDLVSSSQQNSIAINPQAAENTLKTEKNSFVTQHSVASPASTVLSSRDANGIFTNCQNTYNSIDSSGYNTSSTLDVADPHDSLKTSFATCAAASKCTPKFKTANAQEVNKKRNVESGKQLNADSHPASYPVPLQYKQKTKNSDVPVDFNSNPPNSKLPTPIPRTVHSSSSHTPSPTSGRLGNSGGSCCHRNKTDSPHCLQTSGDSNLRLCNPLFENKSAADFAIELDKPLNMGLHEDNVSGSKPRPDSWFASEGRCRHPITSFDILPTEKLLLNKKLLKDGELLLKSILFRC